MATEEYEWLAWFFLDTLILQVDFFRLLVEIPVKFKNEFNELKQLTKSKIVKSSEQCHIKYDCHYQEFFIIIILSCKIARLPSLLCCSVTALCFHVKNYVSSWKRRAGLSNTAIRNSWHLSVNTIKNIYMTRPVAKKAQLVSICHFLWGASFKAF